MRNFKLADSLHTFCLRSSCDCCDGQCGSKKRNTHAKKAGSPDVFEYMLRGTYVFCGLLIVYSLLLINFLSFGDSNNNPFSALFRPLAQAGQELTYSALYVGEAMGNPLEDTIQLYGNGLISLFRNTGEVLSIIPDMLTWTPPVQARTLDNYYW